MNGTPTFLAMCELEDHNVLHSATYRAFKYRPSAERDRVGGSRGTRGDAPCATVCAWVLSVKDKLLLTATQLGEFGLAVARLWRSVRKSELCAKQLLVAIHLPIDCLLPVGRIADQPRHERAEHRHGNECRDDPRRRQPPCRASLLSGHRQLLAGHRGRAATLVADDDATVPATPVEGFVATDVGAPATMPSESRRAVPGCAGARGETDALLWSRPATMPMESRMAVPGCTERSGAAVTLPWLCATPLRPTQSARPTTPYFMIACLVC